MEYKRGTLFAFEGIVSNRTTGLPESIVGCTVEAQLRRFAAGKPTTLVAQLVGTVLDGANGVYGITYDQSLAAAWALGKTCFDIVFVFPDGERVPTVGYVVLDIIDPATQEV